MEGSTALPLARRGCGRPDSRVRAQTLSATRQEGVPPPYQLERYERQVLKRAQRDLERPVLVAHEKRGDHRHAKSQSDGESGRGPNPAQGRKPRQRDEQEPEQGEDIECALHRPSARDLGSRGGGPPVEEDDARHLVGAGRVAAC
jgi:hypothetical protein